MCASAFAFAQLGTACPVEALQAAQVAAADVRAIDLNMGCPIKFSVRRMRHMPRSQMRKSTELTGEQAPRSRELTAMCD